jgi:hypothetical protein
MKHTFIKQGIVLFIANTTGLVNTCNALAASPVIPSVTARDAQTGCGLVVPKMFATKPVAAEAASAPKPWGSKVMSWSGACKNKLADGNGVARMLVGGKVIGTWYGQARAGKLDIGVAEDADGFEAGKFAEAGFSAATTPEIEAAAVAKAKAAVTALVASFDKAGNKASSTYYKKKIEFLDSLLLGE